MFTIHFCIILTVTLNSLVNSIEEGQRTNWVRSLDSLIFLAEQEFHLYDAIKSIQMQLRSNMKFINAWLIDFEDSRIKVPFGSRREENARHVTGNPMAVLRMLRRFTQIESVKGDLGQISADEIIQVHLDRITRESHVPDWTDFEHVMYNLINIVYTYQLPIKQVISGRIKDKHTNIGLTFEDSRDIALHAEKIGAYSESFDWLHAIQTHFNVSLHSHLKRIAVKHDKLLDMINETNSWQHVHRFTTKILPDKLESRDQLISFTQAQTDGRFPWEMSPQFQFQQLCKGREFITEDEKALLFCYYESRIHARWRIAPLKVEVHSLNPRIVRFHDAISDSQMDYLQSASSRKRMEYAKVIKAPTRNDTTKMGEFDVRRISTFAFVGGDSPEYAELERKVALMTGLNVGSGSCIRKEDFAASECAQVAAYATGGQFLFHLDAPPLSWFGPGTGTRMATLMIYLNDVEFGGETAFPTVGIALKSIRKSAIFWFNLMRNGESDIRSLHGGCPVVLGQKRIVNLWILSFASFQRRKCALDRYQ